jgi:hypothetical protein
VIPRYGLLFEINISNVVKVLRKAIKVQKSSKSIA